VELLCISWEFLNTLEKWLELIIRHGPPKSGLYGHLTVFIMVCSLSKMAHFFLYHKEITAEKSSNLSINNCYRLYGVPKVIVSDRDPKFVGKFWQSCMGKLKLN
jgi:hypothetical protein